MDVVELDKLKTLVLSKINQIASMEPDLSVDMTGDEGDEIQGAIILDIAYTFNDRNRMLLKNLQIALNKIQEGEFGVCEECGEKIPYKRLEICPDAQYCIGCAESIEQDKDGIRRRC